jgi:hypothetical protein
MKYFFAMTFKNEFFPFLYTYSIIPSSSAVAIIGLVSAARFIKRSIFWSPILFLSSTRYKNFMFYQSSAKEIGSMSKSISPPFLESSVRYSNSFTLHGPNIYPAVSAIACFSISVRRILAIRIFYIG